MSENQGTKERIKLFIDYLNITTKAFEENLGLSNGYVNSIRKGIGYKAKEKIFARYPELNPGWLITGEGDMFRKNENTVSADCLEDPSGIYRTQCLECKNKEIEIKYLQKENRVLTEKTDKQNQRIGRLELLLEQNKIKIDEE